MLISGKESVKEIDYSHTEIHCKPMRFLQLRWWPSFDRTVHDGGNRRTDLMTMTEILSALVRLQVTSSLAA
jgi:hypothetical protein